MTSHTPMSPERAAAYTAEHVRPAPNVAIPGNAYPDRCLGQVAAIRDALARGDETAAREARRMLDTLCWSADGYPAFVVAALDEAGLRSSAI